MSVGVGSLYAFQRVHAPVQPPSGSVAPFPIFFGQANANFPDGQCGWQSTSDFGARCHTTRWQDNHDNNSLGINGVAGVNAARAAGCQMALLYRLPMSNEGGDFYRGRTSPGGPFKVQGDGENSVMSDTNWWRLICDAYLASNNTYGLDGMFFDGPGGHYAYDFEGLYNDDGFNTAPANQDWGIYTSAQNVLYFQYIRQRLGTKYGMANMGGQWDGKAYINPDGTNMNHSVFAPYVDDVVFEGWGFPIGGPQAYQYTGYSVATMRAQMSECYDWAWNLKRNVTLGRACNHSGTDLLGVPPASYCLFEYCTMLMFVGHPYTGPAASVWPQSTVRIYAYYRDKILGPGEPQDTQWPTSVLGSAQGLPTTDTGNPATASIWTQHFRNSASGLTYTVTANLTTQTGSITQP